MLISVILGWICVILTVITVLRYIARITKSRTLNRLFHRVHIPSGILLLIAGGLHGLLAGNLPGTKLQDIAVAPALFTLNWGTGAFLAGIGLGITYLLRKKLPKLWMELHRILAVVLIVCLALHLSDVGITLPGRIGAALRAQAMDTETVSAAAAITEAPTETAAAASAAIPTVTPAESPTATPAESPTAVPTEAPADAFAESTAEFATESSAESSQDFAEEPTAAPTPEPTPAVTFSGAVLTDGIYTGSAEGFRGTTEVTVTVSGGMVTDIAVDSFRDNQEFFNAALTVLDTIQETQSLEVDAITGATFSSSGLMNAVYNALSPAVVEGTLQITEIDLSQAHRH